MFRESLMGWVRGLCERLLRVPEHQQRKCGRGAAVDKISSIFPETLILILTEIHVRVPIFCNESPRRPEDSLIMTHYPYRISEGGWPCHLAILAGQRMAGLMTYTYRNPAAGPNSISISPLRGGDGPACPSSPARRLTYDLYLQKSGGRATFYKHKSAARGGSPCLAILAGPRVDL